MHQWPATLSTALSGLSASPVWLLKLVVNGVTYWVSDSVFTAPGVGQTKAWVASWGVLREQVSGDLDEICLADLSITLVVDPSVAPNMATLADGDLESAAAGLYLWDLTLSSTPPQEVFRGYVNDVDLPDDLTCILTLEDEATRLKAQVGTKVTRAAYPNADPDTIGQVIPIIFGSVEKVPALPVDAGAMTSLPNSISAGQTSFVLSDASALTSGDVFQIDNERMLVGVVTGNSVTVTRAYDSTTAASHLRGAIVAEVRAEFGYLVADHPLQSIPRVMGRVGQAEMDITAICTLYTGQDGDEHPDHPGRAYVTTPGLITVSQAVDLLLYDGISVVDTLSLLDDLGIVDGISIVDNLVIVDGKTITDTFAINDQLTVNDLLTIIDTIGVSTNTLSVSDTIAVSDTIGINNPAHGHTSNDAATQSQNASTPLPSGGQTLTPTFPSASGNIIGGTYTYTYSFSASTSTPPYNQACNVYLGGIFKRRSLGGTYTDSQYVSGGAVAQLQIIPESWCTLDSSSITAASRNLDLGTVVNNSTQTSTITGSATKTGGATLIGSPAKTGNVVRSNGVSRGGSIVLDGDIVLGGPITHTGSFDKSGTVTRVNGVSLTGSVGKTGTVSLSGNSTANTLVAEELLIDCVAATTDPADAIAFILDRAGVSTPVALYGSFPAGYRFDGCITEQREAIYWLDLLAFQCRAWFRMRFGIPCLTVRPVSGSSVRTISAVALDGQFMRRFSRRKLPIDRVVNVIDLYYDRDWSNTSGEPYLANLRQESSASVARYGERQKPELWRFDFVRDAGMAGSLVAYYLATLGVRPWQVVLTDYLRSADLQAFDWVTLGVWGNRSARIVEVSLSPGNATTIDTVQLTLEVNA